MNKRILVVALLFVSLILLRMSLVSSYEGFAGAEGDMKLIIAKADWCGHCRKAAPEFAKLKQASPLSLKDGRVVIVEELDADQDKAAISELGVKGFPSLMIQKGGSGENVEYPGERTYDAIVAFLEQQ